MKSKTLVALVLAAGAAAPLSAQDYAPTYERTLTLSPATPVAGYQVRVALETGTFNYARAKADGSDIRFFDPTGAVRWPHWIETWAPGGSSVFWVRVPAAGTASLLMRYGDAAAAPVSSGPATFDFFDDFKTVEGWTAYTNSELFEAATEDGVSTVHIDAITTQDGRWSKPLAVTDNIVLESRFKIVEPSLEIGFRASSASSLCAIILNRNGAGKDDWYTGAAADQYLPVPGGPVGEWASVRLIKVGSEIFIERSYAEGRETRTVAPAAMAIDGVNLGFGNYGKGHGHVDYVIVRKHSEVPPSATLGAEGSMSAPVVTSLQQLRLDGTTVIALGGVLPPGQTGFIARAQVSDEFGQDLRLEVDVQEVLAPFGGPGSIVATSAYHPAGSTISVTVSGLAPFRAYRWRLRAESEQGRRSGWMEFGTRPDDPREADFSLPNAAPAGSDPGQYGAAGNEIRLGQHLYPGVEVAVAIFRATLVDPDGHDVRLQVELKPVGVAFDGAEADLHAGDLVPSGGTAEVRVNLPPLAAGSTSWHWRWQGVDEHWGASEWNGYGGNDDPDGADFVLAGGSFNDGGCGLSSGGAGGAWLLAALLLAARRR